MDRRERFSDPLEALRAAQDGRLTELWTALPGIVESYDPQAMTVVVQPAIKGVVSRPDGTSRAVALPLLVDVPVVFPAGGGFALTFPVAAGDDCLVVFAARCIDAWWQSGGVQAALEPRMHNLSDGFALVGPFAQPRRLPGVSARDVQLRSRDGQAFVAIRPDLTIEAQGPAARVMLTPDGELEAAAQQTIRLRAPNLEIAATSLVMASLDGGAMDARMVGNVHLTGDIDQVGGIESTDDHRAGGISLTSHVHGGVAAGGETTGEPQ
jgi:phage baseplate assembly protein gpV